MSGIDTTKLTEFQESWSEMAPELLGQFPHNESELHRISTGLEKMGLDLNQDATYDLLAPGLTAKQFHQTEAFISMLSVLDTYHRSQGFSSQYRNGYLYSKAANLEQLLDRSLPRFEQLNAKAGMLPLATPMMLRDIDLIRNAAQDGTLITEIKKSRNEIAKEEFRSAFDYKRKIEKPNSKPDYSDYKQGLSNAESAIKNIDKAQEHYTPGQIQMDSTSLGWGWSKNTRLETFNRAATETLKNYFIMKVCGTEFAEAKAYHDKGQFVLDSSGGGHGALVLPMQRILERLQEAKHDIRDPQTYLGMGIDIDTFWDYYARERQSVLASGKNTNLVKQELTR